jgi:hypothetical protein
LAALARDFAAFTRSGADDVTIEVELGRPTPVQNGTARFPSRVFAGSKIKVYGWFNHRVCVYPDGAVAETRSVGERRIFWIHGGERNIVREVTYKFLLSAVGEALDCKGYHRAHAFGFAHAGRAGLLLAASGRGKSALASLLCLREKGYTLFSDESPLVRGRSATVLPFPTRISIAPDAAAALGLGAGEIYVQRNWRSKTLFPFPTGGTAVETAAHFILRGELQPSGGPEIVRAGRWRLGPGLSADLVVGLGLAQMAEWMLRGNALPRLAWIAFRRLAAAGILLWRAKQFYIFKMSKDARANAVCLELWLSSSARL